MRRNARLSLIRITSLFAALSVLVAWDAQAAQHEAVSRVELSGSMGSDGDISGSLYNNDPTRMIHVTEIVVTSSRGRRIFRVDYLVPPQTVIRHVFLATGLHLDFSGKNSPRDSWGWRASRAAWIKPDSWILWRGITAASAHGEHTDCMAALEHEIARSAKESSTRVVDEKDPEVGRVRIRYPSGTIVALRCAEGVRAGRE